MQFHDRGIGSMTVLPESCGDPSLVRRDGIISYNLAVVTDDIADGVTEVVRGSDLLDHTAVQIQIWKRLGATPPTWLHSPLVLGDDGRKLSKSHGSAHIGLLRDCGWTPSDVWRQVLPWLQLDEFDNLWDASGVFSPSPRMSQIIRLHADASDHPPSPKEGFHWSPTGHPSSR